MKVTDTEVIKRIADGPIGQEIRAQRERELDQERVDALALIEHARTRGETEQAKAAERAERTLAVMRDAEAKLREAQRAHAEAGAASMGISHEIAREVGDAERILVETAPDVAVDFLRELLTTYERVRHGIQEVRVGHDGAHGVRDGKRITIATNARSTSDYLAAVRSIREEVHRLIVTEPSRGGIEARVAELRRSLPTIQTELVETRP